MERISFPPSYVLINGERQATTYEASGGLSVTVDPSLLSIVGELPVVVVNPNPGGRSNSVPLTVYQSLPISARTIVYDSVGKMLYASIPSESSANPNTVIPLDPSTGQTGAPIAVGNEPDLMAVSDDGSYLFVGLDADHAIRRINLKTLAVDETFSFPLDAELGLKLTAHDMKVVPGSPQSVVVALWRNASPAEAGVALFNGTGLVNYLANAGNSLAIDSFTFTSSPSTIYSIPFGFTSGFFSTLGVSSSGIQLISSGGVSCCDETVGSLVASDGTLLYTNSGEVWNPQTKKLLGTYTQSSSLFYEPSVVPDASTGRTFFLDSSSGYEGQSEFTDILSFDPTTFTAAGTTALAIPGSSSSLVRWGADGFAFISGVLPSNRIILLRSSIANTGTGAAPALNALVPNEAGTGSSDFVLTINGTGFIPASVVEWNGDPRETTYVSGTQISALISASDLASGGIDQVTVANPSGGTSSALTFNISGPQVTLSTNTLNFGTKQVGATSPAAQVSVTNSGASPVTGLTVAITGTDAGSFSESSSCGATLAPRHKLHG